MQFAAVTGRLHNKLVASYSLDFGQKTNLIRARARDRARARPSPINLLFVQSPVFYPHRKTKWKRY